MENTNLPTTQNNLVNQNPLAVLKNLNAFIKIKEFDKVGYLVMPICNKHAVLSGVDKEIDDFTKEEIAKYTALHLKNLTFEEIEIAFQNERFNLYDKKSIHYNFFSIDYFVEIITKYKVWKQSQMTIHNIPMNTNLLPEFSKSSDQENIKRIRIEFIKHIFNDLKETRKDYISDSFTLYEDFIECKLIEVTKQQKKDLYAVIVKETIKETNDEINSTFKKHKKKQLQSYVQKIKNKNIDNQVANKCMAYLVCKSMRSHQSAEEILKKLKLDK
jgi:hypothetical protein